MHAEQHKSAPPRRVPPTRPAPVAFHTAFISFSSASIAVNCSRSAGSFFCPSTAKESAVLPSRSLRLMQDADSATSFRATSKWPLRQLEEGRQGQVARGVGNG